MGLAGVKICLGDRAVCRVSIGLLVLGRGRCRFRGELLGCEGPAKGADTMAGATGDEMSLHVARRPPPSFRLIQSKMGLPLSRRCTEAYAAAGVTPSCRAGGKACGFGLLCWSCGCCLLADLAGAGDCDGGLKEGEGRGEGQMTLDSGLGEGLVDLMAMATGL